MNTRNDESLVILIQTEWELLNAAMLTLKKSVEKCQSIGKKKEYSFEEQESFDSLTSKFNRTSDIFTQKVVRTIWILLHEPFVPFIDMMNTCEKMQIIRSADAMIEIRDLRNQIAHEYIPEAVNDLIADAIDLSYQLIENIQMCKIFIESRGWGSIAD